MQIAWVGNFFLHEHYFTGNKTLIPMAVFLAFEILFLICRRHNQTRGEIGQCNLGRCAWRGRNRDVLGILLFLIHQHREPGGIDSELSFSGRPGTAWAGSGERIFQPSRRRRRHRCLHSFSGFGPMII